MNFQYKKHQCGPISVHFNNHILIYYISLSAINLTHRFFMCLCLILHFRLTKKKKNKKRRNQKNCILLYIKTYLCMGLIVVSKLQYGVTTIQECPTHL